MRLRVLLVYAFCFSLGCMCAAKGLTHSQAKQLVIDNFRLLERAKSETSHINMTLVTAFWDTLKYKRADYSVDMQMVDGTAHIRSGKYEMFQSEDEVIVVDHNNKMLFRRGIGRSELPAGFGNEMFKMTDSLLAKLDVQSCRTIKESGEERIEVVMIPNTSVNRQLQFAKITYVFHASDQSVQRIYIEYTRASIFKINMVIYNVLDYDGHTLKAEERELLEEAFAKRSSLLTMYKEYHVKDLRKKH